MGRKHQQISQHAWDLTLENRSHTTPDIIGALAIIAALEKQLAALDQAGAAIAAAHVDAAIQQLRLDQARAAVSP